MILCCFFVFFMKLNSNDFLSKDFLLYLIELKNHYCRREVYFVDYRSIHDKIMLSMPFDRYDTHTKTKWPNTRAVITSMKKFCLIVKSKNEQYTRTNV
jgi:hypothetical protein